MLGTTLGQNMASNPLRHPRPALFLSSLTSYTPHIAGLQPSYEEPQQTGAPGLCRDRRWSGLPWAFLQGQRAVPGPMCLHVLFFEICMGGYTLLL